MRKEHIEYLKEILKTGSITAAAEKLNITPQALSKSIKLLEKEIGFKLFDRDSQGVTYTAAGVRFLNSAVSFYEEIESISQEKEKKYTTVQLNIVKGFSSHFAIDLIKGISDGNNDIHLELNMQEADILVRQLQDRAINYFIAAKPKYNGEFYPNNEEFAPDINHQPIKNGEIAKLCCLVSKSFPIYNFKSMSVKTAAKYPVSFIKTNYEDTASIRYILNRITTFDNEIITDNIIEHKMNILLGKYIGFDFINDLSEWKGSESLVKIIPLKEQITLNLCAITKDGEIDKEISTVLENAIFS